MAEKVMLTEEQIALTLGELMVLLGLTKSTAYRAKQRGYYIMGHHNVMQGQAAKDELLASLPPVQKVEPGKEVVLSKEELKLGNRRLAARYGMGKEKARKALKDGSFTLGRPTTRGSRVYECWKPAVKGDYDPASRFFRVNIAPQEAKLSDEKLMELYSHFGISKNQCKEARRRGYFLPFANRPFEPMVNAQKFAELATELQEDAKKGATSALVKFYGTGSRTVLKGITYDDLVSAALERLYKLSGHEKFDAPLWRRAVARNGALELLRNENRRRGREEATLDQIEGRFDEDE